MASRASGNGESRKGKGSSAGDLAVEVSALQASLLGRLHDELGDLDGEAFATAAQRLAEAFGSVTAAAIAPLSRSSTPGAGLTDDAGGNRDPRGGQDAVSQQVPPGRDSTFGQDFDPRQDAPVHSPAGQGAGPDAVTGLRDSGAASGSNAEGGSKAGRGSNAERGSNAGRETHPALFQPGEMRRRLDQLVETHRRYGHPFGLMVFDIEGPGARNGSTRAMREIVGKSLGGSSRILDETFRLEETAVCVLAPNQTTVGVMRMAERLLNRLEELESVEAQKIQISAGVVACPEHGTDAESLLHKADEAMWRARSVGQPVGVGTLQDR